MHEECMVSLRFGSRGWSTVLSAGLVLASGQAWAATRADPIASSPATTSATNGGIEVTVDSSVTNSATTRSWVEERAARALGALEHPLTPGDLIRIDVGGGPFDYRIALMLLRQGVALSAKDQPEEIACACGSDEMLETVATAIAAAAQVLDEVAAREATAAAAAERRREEEETRQRQEDERKRQAEQSKARQRSSMLKRAGVATFVTGGALTIGGIVMMTQPPQSASRWQANDRDWTVPGRTLLGIGVAAMTSGLTLLIVDAVRCRRNRSRCEAPKTAWMPEHDRWTAQRGGGPK